MLQEVKEKWTKALRKKEGEEGFFKQGKGCLYNTQYDSYCCLGVLCKVMDIPQNGPFFGFGSNELSCDLDMAYARSIGIQSTTPFITMNDLEDKTFPEIADYIDKYVPVTTN